MLVDHSPQCTALSERHCVTHWIFSSSELCRHGISSQRVHKKSLKIKACWYFLCSGLVAIIYHSLSTAVLEINLELVIFNLKNKITEALKKLQIHLRYKKTKNCLKRASVLLYAITTAFNFCSHHRSFQSRDWFVPFRSDIRKVTEMTHSLMSEVIHSPRQEDIHFCSQKDWISKITSVQIYCVNRQFHFGKLEVKLRGSKLKLDQSQQLTHC